jgi:hypothetical protein
MNSKKDVASAGGRPSVREIWIQEQMFRVGTLALGLALVLIAGTGALVVCLALLI